jgi:hypothetical protein
MIWVFVQFLHDEAYVQILMKAVVLMLSYLNLAHPWLKI